MSDPADFPSLKEDEDSWVAFDDHPEASGDDWGKNKDEFVDEKDDDDEWNEFEFASAPQMPQAATVVSPDIDETSDFPSGTVESSFSKENRSESVRTETSEIISKNLKTLICDLDQILHSCIQLRSGNSEGVQSEEGGKLGNGNEECSFDHSGLDILSYSLGEDIPLEKRAEDSSSDPVTEGVSTLWKSLRLIEEAAALKYQWAEARNYEKHLNALRVDLKLAKLRNPKLPAYAWQLSNSALTPQKSGQSSHSIISSPDEQKLTVDDRESTGFTAVGLSPMYDPGSGRVTDGSTNGSVVSPVQFDWNSSGLKNPLCEGVVDSCSMNLDYFSDPKTGSSSHVAQYSTVDGHLEIHSETSTAWKTDLKSLGLITDDDSIPHGSIGDISQSAASISKSNQTQSNSLLSKLMNANHRTAPGPLITSSMSDDARRLLDTLPDLSFMLSPVLMFPIRDLDRIEGNDDVQL